MKQIFFDKNRSVFIKVFQSSRQLEREKFGIKIFSNLVKVPKIVTLDSKVAAITSLDGFLGYQVSEQDLNIKIVNLLLLKKPMNINSFSILSEIINLEKFFSGQQAILKRLLKIKVGLKKVSLFPIHGDLQKQNIVLMEGDLGLIDFEHTIIAPKELEICNSLFFDDGNCLDSQSIVSMLPMNFFDPKMIEKMLRFYFLRQISLGLDQVEATIRLEVALKRASRLCYGKVKAKLSREDLYLQI